MDHCLTANEFERYARDELNQTDAARVQQHLAACSRCRAEYEVLQSDNRFASKLRARLEPSGLEPTRPIGSAPARPDDETAPHAAGTGGQPPGASGAHRERFPEIEGYTLRRVLGRGGMGVVYEAIQEKLQRPVALKVLPAIVGSAHPDLVTRFHREAAAAGKLHHTNIIPIYDFGESRDGYYYAMELIDGQSLATAIRRFAGSGAPHISSTAMAELLVLDTPAPSVDDAPAAAAASTATARGGPGSTGGSSGSRGRHYFRHVARWIADAAEALHYAHLQGLVHRDVKPGNLMLCNDGRIMILDFGLVKTTGDHSVTATGSLIGTYRYMSPEQVGAKRITVDARSDVYSLGATLYELLTFQPPFPTTEQSELLSQILFKEPPPPRKTVPAVPVDLQTICLKALEKAPGARYQTARAMADDLNSFLGDRAIIARPQGPVRRLAKFVRRRRLETIAASALLLVVVVAALGVTTYRRWREAVRINMLTEANRLWYQEREFDAAESIYQEVLRKYPDDYAARVNLANTYKDKYYFVNADEALLARTDRLLDEAIALNPNRPAAWNAKGVFYQALGRDEEAIAAYKTACALAADHYEVWVNLAMCQATQGNFEEAERCGRRGTELSGAGGGPMPWRILAAIQLHLGRSEVVDTLATARELSRNQDVPTLLLQARYHLKQDRADSARQALNLAVSADTLTQAGDTQGQSATGKTETIPRTKRTLALAYLRNEQWRLATEAAREAIEAGDRPAFGYLILAIARGHLGDAAAAQRHVSQAEAAWPAELEAAAQIATQDGRSVWIDTADELEELRTAARALLGGSPGTP